MPNKQHPFKEASVLVSAKQAAKMMRVLSNETRLMILCRLQDEEISVGELKSEFDISQSALSQHLAILRKNNLVRTKKVRQKIYYAVADPSVLKIINTLVEIFCPELFDMPTPRK